MASNELPAGDSDGACVLVTGATGLVGSALVAGLLRDSRRVLVLTRDARAASAALGPRVQAVEQLGQLPAPAHVDAVVHLAGARVLDRRWSAARRRELVRSRVDVAARVVDFMRRLPRPPRVMVCASAASYYGASGGASFAPRTEASPPQPGKFASDLCATIEQEAGRARELGVRVVPLRFGIVLARQGGAFPMLALAARAGLGAVLGRGVQPVSWIHLDDAVALIRFAIDRDDIASAMNAVAPETPAQAEFTRALAASFGRRAWLRVPAFALRALLGEMATLLLDGQAAVPLAARQAGFEFRFATLAAALADLTRRA